MSFSYHYDFNFQKVKKIIVNNLKLLYFLFKKYYQIEIYKGKPELKNLVEILQKKNKDFENKKIIEY